MLAALPPRLPGLDPLCVGLATRGSQMSIEQKDDYIVNNTLLSAILFASVIGSFLVAFGMLCWQLAAVADLAKKADN